MIDRRLLVLAASIWPIGVAAGETGRAEPSPAPPPPPPLRLENDRLAVVFDARTGAWSGLIDKATGEDLAAGPADAVPRELAPAAGDGPVQVEAARSETTAEGERLELKIRSGPWIVVAENILHDRRPLLERRFSAENDSGGKLVLRGATFALPPLVPGDGACVIFPGTLPVGDRPVAGIEPGKPLRPRSADGLALLRSEKARRAVGVWSWSEDEYMPVSAAAAAGRRAAVLSHRQDVLAPLAPGGRAALGTQFIWIARGSRDDALRSARAAHEAAGLRAPPGAIPRLRERVIYCGHPGGVPEKGFRGYGGFTALDAYIPTLRRLGVDVLWLLPIFEHGDGTQWNLYSPFDPFAISPLYGTPDELRALSEHLRAAGIDLVFDLVPHGPPDFTPLAKAHPEWTCRNEDGSVRHEWGQLAFDTACRGWQEHMARAAEHHAREFGVAGARVDVAAGSPPNWSPDAPYRPSHSTLGGGLGMDRAIREGFLRARKDVLIIPEEYTGASIFHGVGDLTYDAQLFFLLVDLQDRKAPPEEWATSLATFLHDQALALPPGALKMRWIANHDTVSWTFQKKRPRDAYGLDRSRALFALTALIDGVPMVYQGEEDPAIYGGSGEPNLAWYEKVLGLRRSLPALAAGGADYAGARATGGVLAFVRGSGKDAAVVLVSFDPGVAGSKLALPESLRGAPAWRDRLGGDRFAGGAEIAVPMPPHGVRVLVQEDGEPAKTGKAAAAGRIPAASSTSGQ